MQKEVTMSVTTGRTSHGNWTSTVRVGDAAADFILKSQDREDWKLSDIKGTKNAVLAFYPFAFSDV